MSYIVIRMSHSHLPFDRLCLNIWVILSLNCTSNPTIELYNNSTKGHKNHAETKHCMNVTKHARTNIGNSRNYPLSKFGESRQKTERQIEPTWLHYQIIMDDYFTITIIRVINIDHSLVTPVVTCLLHIYGLLVRILKSWVFCVTSTGNAISETLDFTFLRGKILWRIGKYVGRRVPPYKV